MNKHFDKHPSSERIPPAENKTERFKGVIHKLRTRLSCSALDTASSSSASINTISPCPSPTYISTPPASPISPITPTSPLTPYEWFSNAGAGAGGNGNGNAGSGSNAASTSPHTSTSSTSTSTVTSTSSSLPFSRHAFSLSTHALSTPYTPHPHPSTHHPYSRPYTSYSLSAPYRPAKEKEGAYPYRIAMEIERSTGEAVWGEHFTFYSTSTLELEITAGRIREFKEGRG